MHWYTKVKQLRPNVWMAERFVDKKKDGTPAKVVKKVNARKAFARMGVTSYLDLVGGVGGLLDWAGKLGVDASIAVWKEFAKEGLDADLWKVKALEKWKELRESSAEIGGNMHDAISTYITSGGKVLPPNTVWSNACVNVKLFLKSRNVDITDKTISSEHCFLYEGEGICYAGTTDLMIPDRLLVDWKTVTKDRPAKITELAQISAYRKFGTGKEKCENVYISQADGSIIRTTPWMDDDIKMGWEFFKLAYRVTEMMEEFESKGGDND